MTYKAIKTKKTLPVRRAGLLVLLVILVASGATYALLQSQDLAVNGSVITTGTADLQISRDNLSYTDAINGFGFNGIVPGAPAVPSEDNTLFLRNTGSTPLTLRAGLNMAPDAQSTVNLAKVYISIYNVTNSGSTLLVTKSLSQLRAANDDRGLAIGSQVVPGAAVKLRLAVSMDSDAFNGQSATISNVNLVFNGFVSAQ